MYILDVISRSTASCSSGVAIMASPNSKNTGLVLCFLLLLTLTGSLVSGEVMYIVNEIADVVELKVHCKSAENDLGVIDVSYQWRYTFSFTQNFAGTTLFSCDFMTNSTAFPTTHADVYKGCLDVGPCKWVAQVEGLFCNGAFATAWGQNF